MSDNPNPSMRVASGFTLLELLVAVAVFAVMAALAYGGLNTVLAARGDAEAEVERLASLQTAFFRIGRDMEHAAPRSIRDAFGDPQPALKSPVAQDDALAQVIEFTRAGRANPQGAERSELQRVAYGLREGILLRMSWDVLDRAQDSEPYVYELLDQVQSVEFRFLDQEGAWHAEWPLESTNPETPVSLVDLPRAVEISVDVEGWGRLTRVFRMAG